MTTTNAGDMVAMFFRRSARVGTPLRPAHLAESSKPSGMSLGMHAGTSFASKKSYNMFMFSS